MTLSILFVIIVAFTALAALLVLGLALYFILRKPERAVKKLLALSAAILILAAAFLFLLDVRLMTSRTGSSANTAASRTGDPNTPWNFAPQATGLYVEGSERLAENLQSRLNAQLQNQAHIGPLTAINAPADRFDLPILYVEIMPQKHIWTPFYASAEYRLAVSYASDGNIFLPRPG